MVYVVIDKYFFLFLNGLEDFSKSKAITDSPFNPCSPEGFSPNIFS